ncbi:MAG: hypothetical protein WC860_06790, partial [Candidatus Margulisiibacteriota bacterium]
MQRNMRIKKKKTNLIVIITCLVLLGLAGIIGGCSQAAKEIIPEPEPLIKLTAEKVAGEDNAFLLTWNGEYNRYYVKIDGYTKLLGKSATSCVIRIDVNSTEEIYVLTLDRDVSLFSNRLNLFVPIPAGYPAAPSLNYVIGDFVYNPSIGYDEARVTLNWTMDTDPANFDHYEVWDINEWGVGYYGLGEDPIYHDTKTDTQIYETKEIGGNRYGFKRGK